MTSSVSEAEALSGYLFKKARNDKWQRRWFETQGFYLVYYKNRKMEKLLAALSLPQVGEIRLIPQSDDPERQVGLFALELNNRVYTLRANSNEEAELWVRIMLKLREHGQNQQQIPQQQHFGGGVEPYPDSPNNNGGGGGGGSLEIGTASPVKKPPSSPVATWVKEEKRANPFFCPCC
jgi:hypothetical protein